MGSASKKNLLNPMSNPRNYYVIQFLDDTPDVISNACVPRSWILHRITNDKIRVAYPKENPNLTQKRIENGETIAIGWEILMAKVLHEADDLNEGILWMRENNKPWMKTTLVTNKTGRSTPQFSEVSLRKDVPLSQTVTPDRFLMNFSGNVSVKSQRTKSAAKEFTLPRNRNLISESFLPVTLHEFNPNPGAPETATRQHPMQNGNKSSPILRNLEANSTVKMSASIPRPSCQLTDPLHNNSLDKLCFESSKTKANDDLTIARVQDLQTGKLFLGRSNNRGSSSNDIRNCQPSVDQNPSTSPRTKNDSKIQDPQIQATPRGEYEDRNERRHVDPEITAAHKKCPFNRDTKTDQLAETPISSSNETSRKRKRDSQNVCAAMNDHSQNKTSLAFETSKESNVSIIIESSDEEMSEKEIAVKRSNDATNVEVGNNSRNVAEVCSSFVNVHENTENTVSDSSEALFEKVANITETLEMFKGVINRSIIEFADIIQKGIETINQVCESKINEVKEITASTQHRVTEITKGDTLITEAEKNESDDNDAFSDSDDEHEVPKKKQKEEEPFVLPHEFNPNDASWTLRHKKSSKGIVEVVPRSHVYIDKIKLEHYKQNATNSKMLARNLLSEIFSENALKVCSLKGKRNNCYKLKTTDTLNNSSARPGLDERALTVLLDFVKLHGQAKNWNDFELLTVSNSLRSKLRNLRPKQKSDAKTCTGVSKEKQKICTCTTTPLN